MTLADRQGERLAAVDVVLNQIGDMLTAAERDTSRCVDYTTAIRDVYVAVRASRLTIYSQDVTE